MIECPGNEIRTRALVSLARRHRQQYASRMGVLDFTDCGGVLVHTFFDGLAFPWLKEVILERAQSGPEQRNSREFQLGRYLQPTLHSLKLIDRTLDWHGDQVNWLTASFLEEVASKCPDLQEVTLSAPEGHRVESMDLARFFGSIRPRAVSLDLGWSHTRPMLTSGVLSALSHGGRLASLISADEDDDREQIETVQLQRFLTTTTKPFPYLERLDLSLKDTAVALLPRCFPAVTWLRLEAYSARKDESALKSIASMSQLQFLDIVGPGSTNGFCIPARAFIALGCLTELKSLSIGTSFFPCCMSEDDSEEPENFEPYNKLTRADVSEMFSRLTNLQHLSICRDEYTRPDHLYDSISKYCPQLSSLDILGKPDLYEFILPYAPIFENLRRMTLEGVQCGSIGASQAARLIDNFAPKLRTLSFKDDIINSLTAGIHAELVKLRKTQRVFKDSRGSRTRELILEDDEMSEDEMSEEEEEEM